MVSLPNKSGLLYLLIWIVSLSIFILFHGEPYLIGDEGHYLKLASRLQQGWYTNSEELDLWYGPGYPLVLAVVMFFSKDLFLLRLLNALFISLSAFFVWNHFRKFISPLILNLSTVFVFLNPSAHKIITQTITEPFTLFLITCIVLLILKGKTPIWIGFLIGLLTLTKVVFFLILPVVLLCYLFVSKRINWKYLIKTTTVALIVSLPYLIYTYSLTNKIYYPGSSGGQNLYWQAASKSPLMGEWHHLGGIDYLEGTNIEDSKKSELLKEFKRHEDFFESIKDYNPVEQDILTKKKAFDLIKTDPFNYLRNSLYTVSRMFFSFPVSNDFSLLKKLVYLPNGMIQLSMLCLFVFYSLKIKDNKLLMWLFVLAVYITVHVALNGLARQYLIITPVILIIGLELLVQHKKATLNS